MTSKQPSEDVCKRIRDKHPDVDPIEFHEFLRDQLSATYADGEVVGANQVPQVVEFMIEAEVDHALDDHMTTFKDNRRRRGEIAETIKIKNFVPVKPKALEANELDRSIRAGGLTRVHVAVEERNLPALRKLHEQGAKLDVKDNSGQAPIDLARSLGYLDIVTFIEEALAGAAQARVK